MNRKNAIVEISVERREYPGRLDPRYRTEYVVIYFAPGISRVELVTEKGAAEMIAREFNLIIEVKK